MLQVALFLLNILIFLQNQISTALTISENLSETTSASASLNSLFVLNGREHELPKMTVISKGKTYHLESGSWLKMSAFSNSNSTIDTDEVTLFEINVTATFPFYVFYDRGNKSPLLLQRRYASDIWNETSFVFQQTWYVYLSYLKPRNSSFEFRSNVAPFFGSSVQWFYDENDDTVNLHNSPDIPQYRTEFFDRLRKGQNDAVNKCDAYLFHHNRNNEKTGVPDRFYACSFADGTKGSLSLSTFVLNSVPMDGSSEAHENCFASCEGNSKCPRSQLNAYSHGELSSSSGYCTKEVNEGNSRKRVNFSPIYASLPQGTQTQPTPEIYYKLEDVRLDKMISLDPIEAYHRIGSSVTVRCNISEAFAATPFRFALKHKGTETLKFLKVEEDEIFSSNLWSRSTPYNIVLDQADIQRIYCFAPLLGSFGWINASLPIQVTDDTEGTSLAVPISVAVVALILIAAVIAIVFKMKQKGILNIQILSTQILTEQEYQDFLHGNVIKDNSNPNQNIFSNAFHPQFIIDRPNLVFDIDAVLGSGQFNIVMKGWLKNSQNGKTEVAVKTTKKDIDVMYVKALMCEVKTMAYVGDHRNVVGFFGACIENLMQGKLLVAVEFCSNGDLLGCLRKEKASLKSKPDGKNFQMSSDLPPSLLTKLVQWSRDIASGMEFIGSIKVVHGDLAARNVLVDGDNVAKISDFGLSRQLLQDYTVCKKKTEAPIPWKWMAVESLTDLKFSVQSDTWAFGIVLWEIFSLGDAPYPGLNYDHAFVQKLFTGFCPCKPTFASDEWYDMMGSCWNVDPELRPEMSSLLDRINDSLKQIN